MTNANAHRETAARDFSRKTLDKLSARGCFLIGIQMVPDYSKEMPMANAETCYVVNDNDCGRVLSFVEVLALAANGTVLR